MTVVPVDPIIMTDVVCTIGGVNDFAEHVSRVELTPSRSTVNWAGLSPNARFSKAGRATWTCTLDYAQDWKTPGSLARYLWDNAGSTVAMTFEPEAGDGTSWTVDVDVVEGAIGGAVDSVPVGSVTLPVQGRPTPTFPV